MTVWLVPILFQLFRLLAIVPAVFGTLWNLYHVFRPPDGLNEWRVDYSVSVLWVCMSQLCPRNAMLIARSVCADRVAMSAAHDRAAEAMASVLLSPRRPHPSPRPARYVSLQSPHSIAHPQPRAAICWPATHLTLTILNHEVRPLICWAAIGTTTCCSRSIQLWVTSNIVPAPPPPGAPPHEEELLRKSRRRRWDWALVGVEAALPAGILYFVTAWAVVLRREFMGC